MPTANPNSPAPYGTERTHLRVLRRRLEYVENRIAERQRRGEATALEQAEGDALDWIIAFAERLLEGERR
jgi:hypothetical protein